MKVSVSRAAELLSTFKRGQAVDVTLLPQQADGGPLQRRMFVQRGFHYFPGCKGIAADAQVTLSHALGGYGALYVRACWLADGGQAIALAAGCRR
jgi:hypothetical protein